MGNGGSDGDNQSLYVSEKEKCEKDKKEIQIESEDLIAIWLRQKT